MAEVVEDHVRTHLVDAERHPGALNPEAADQCSTSCGPICGEDRP